MIIRYFADGVLRSVKTPSIGENDIKILSENEGKKITVTALRDITLDSAVIPVEFKKSRKSSVFVNGYQSWTATKEYVPADNLLISEKQRNLDRLPQNVVKGYAFKSYGSQFFHKADNSALLGVDYAYVKGNEEIFIGNLNYKNAYLLIEIHKTKNRILLLSDVDGKELKKGETFTVFDFFTDSDAERGQKEYFSRLTPKSTKKLFGYTSWYNHYQDIDENKIYTALDNADERFDLFQIDDGFETFVGDWLNVDQSKFPNGLKPIVDKIHARGMLAGIWLAPFAAEEKSEIFRTRPDVIAKDEKGDFIKAGSNWSGFYPLDLNNPYSVEYVRKILRFYVDLGFDFFKLDFLYATNLKPLRGKTRSETAEFAYSILCEELKDKKILGCGATLSNGFEKFDFMRIGPDVSLKFDDVWYMKFMHSERISTKVTLQNTIYRSVMDGKAFLNDPDVILLRDDNIDLSAKQRYALAKINALFGSLLMTSDNPKTYDKNKSEILDETLTLFNDGKVLCYRRRKRFIYVEYEVGGKKHAFNYDTKKGVMKNG
ncbi:MAG: alpha-galactosidase [Clostridia bacterium]|nr:alpha-galactosidase [Clostridia bacterium]